MIYRFGKYLPSRNLTDISIIISFIYLLYRCDSDSWEFTAVSFAPFLKYADILILFTISQVILRKFVRRRQHKPMANGFFNDQPLGEYGKDKLGYEKYAIKLSQRILNSNFDKSFAVGINGRWGLGKTSFIDLLKKHMHYDNVVAFDFNPWMSHSPQSIITDFFEALMEAIKPYHSTLASIIHQYSAKLTNFNSESTKKYIQTAVSLTIDNDTIKDLYESINESLRKINRRLVIYIDDLDRLDKDEIIEVIKIIRNTANFYQTFFIVAYDRNYVINSLKQQNAYNQEAFLEKIFQIEITLPYFSKIHLRQILADKLISHLPADQQKIINEEVIGTAASNPIFLDEWLESIRDVTRLSNAILLNIDELIGEVDFNEFLRIELLRLKYPAVYELLFRKTSEFLTVKSEGNDKYKYVLREVDSENQSDSFGTTMETCLKRYLNACHQNLGVPENEISSVVSFVESLFPRNRSFVIGSRSHLSIVYPSKFFRYFAYSLLDGNLSEVDFSIARALSKEEFNSKISDWVKSGYESELRERFSIIDRYDNREDYEKIITAIFHFANQPTFHQRITGLNIVNYDTQDLIKKLDNYDKILSSKYYSNNVDIEDFRKFVRGLFNNASSPYYFESELIKSANHLILMEFPLSQEELKSISLNYLERYCSEIDRIDSNLWVLMFNSKQTIKIPSHSNSFTKEEELPDESKQIFKKFVFEKNIDGFIEEIVASHHIHPGKYAIRTIIEEIWDGWEPFKKDIYEIKGKESLHLAEFKEFLEVFASKNYKQYVEFQFKSIPVNEPKKL